MALSFNEKNHWRTRIVERIEKTIEHKIASTQPDYLRAIKHRSRKQAIESLGIADIVQEEIETDKEITRLQSELRLLGIRKAVIATGEDHEVRSKQGCYTNGADVEARIRETSEIEKRKIMETDDLGREILRLRREKEVLLDKVSLAISGDEIRELWQSFDELLANKAKVRKK